jgi:hypothetical protein
MASRALALKNHLRGNTPMKSMARSFSSFMQVLVTRSARFQDFGVKALRIMSWRAHSRIS